MTEPSPAVHVDIETRSDGGRIATVIYDNRYKLNCLPSPLLTEFVATFERLAADDDLRAVVLTGAGDKAFIGGADINELSDLTPETARAFISKVQAACGAVRALPVPVVARIRGYCLGAGLEIAAACDLRIADDSAVFGMPEVRVGLPSVVEAALLPQLVGWGKAREMVYLALNYSAAEAAQMGLVERLVAPAELDAAVAEWVDHIASAGPLAIRAQKALIAKWEALPLADAIQAGIDSLADSYHTDEPRRMMQPFFDRKR